MHVSTDLIIAPIEYDMIEALCILKYGFKPGSVRTGLGIIPHRTPPKKNHTHTGVQRRVHRRQRNYTWFPGLVWADRDFNPDWARITLNLQPSGQSRNEPPVAVLVSRNAAHRALSTARTCAKPCRSTHAYQVMSTGTCDGGGSAQFHARPALARGCGRRCREHRRVSGEGCDQ